MAERFDVEHIHEGDGEYWAGCRRCYYDRLDGIEPLGQQPTEEELDMSFEEFFDHVAAEEGLDQSVADEYKQAFARAIGAEPASPHSGSPLVDFEAEAERPRFIPPPYDDTEH